MTRWNGTKEIVGSKIFGLKLMILRSGSQAFSGCYNLTTDLQISIRCTVTAIKSSKFSPNDSPLLSTLIPSSSNIF